jgi:DNA/RNA-binding domain of Phe-tRNA-synthetase-like protein
VQKIIVSKILANRVSAIELSCIECDVLVDNKSELLWNEIQQKVAEISQSQKVENISQMEAIYSSRKAYKACGKDPARYRLSAEALLRRVVKRNEIYQINNVVDLLNLVSISTGFSIGGYDVGKIEGDVVFGVGENNEPYIGIGRGELNIESLPVFRDEIGAFGTSTSDSVRTAVSLQTKRFLMIIIDYASSSQLKGATEFAVHLLEKYASATNFEFENITYNETD